MANVTLSNGVSVDPSATWLSYRCRVDIDEEDHVIRHKPLAGVITVGSGGPDDTGQVAPLLKERTLDANRVSSTVPDRIQRLSAPSAMARLIGSAARFGLRINPPTLDFIDGRPVVQIRRNVRETQLGAIQGVPVWGLAWDITYMVVTNPKYMPVIANPALLTDGTK